MTARNTRPKNDEPNKAIVEEKRCAVDRVECAEYAWFLSDTDCAHDCNDDEPHYNDRAEKRSHPGRSATLHGKKADKNNDREGHHRLLKRRGDNLQPLDGRYDGERWRDSGVTVEERRARNAKKQQEVLAALRHGLRERHQRKGTTFSMEVCPKEDEDVLERHK